MRTDSLQMPLKLILFCVVVITLTAATASVYTLSETYDEAVVQGQLNLERAIRTFWELLHTKGSNFRIRDGRLQAGAYVINGNFELPDKIQRIFGGTATVFMGDTRVSTNVLQADGTRAVGTKLTGPAFEAIFQKGIPFRGEAKILGIPYFTAYDPIRDADGKIIGVLYTGVKKSVFLSRYQGLRNNILATVFCVVTVFGICLALLLRVSKRAEQTRSNDLSFLQTLIDTLPHPFFYKDRTGRYMGCNAAFESYLGRPRSELIGKTVHDIAPPELADSYHRADESLYEATDGTQVYESPVRYADGSLHEVVFYKAVIHRDDGSTAGLIGSLLDITDRKRAEVALKEQKELSESLLQNSAVPIFVIDGDHRVLFWNRACEVLTGIEASMVLGTDQHWQAFYTSESTCLADLVIDGTTADQAALGKHYTLIRKSPLIEEGLEAEGWFSGINGMDRYLFFHAAPIKNSSGAIIAAIQTLEDITDRKRREEELAQIAQAVSLVPGEGFFASLVKFLAATMHLDWVMIGQVAADAPDQLQAIAVFADGSIGDNITYDLANSPYEHVLANGICSYGRGVREAFSLDTLLTAERIEGFVGIPLQDSARRVVGVMAGLHRQPITDTGKCLSLLQIFAGRVAAELERKVVEAQLNRLSLAIEQSPTMVMITDSGANIEYVNPKFTEVTGHSQDELIGRNPSVLMSGCHHGEFFRQLWQTISAGQRWCGEMQSRKKNGDLYWEQTSISPIKNELDEITHFVAVMEDISERKKLENELRQAQKMEALGTLAGGIAHDFNNILTAIIGYGSIVKMGLASGSSQTHYLDQILGAAERAASLTKSLLTYSRKQVFEPKPVDLNDVIRRAYNLLTRIIGEDVELRTDLHPHELIAMVDPLQIEQVLFNLASNARDAMPGHGTLTISSGQAEPESAHAHAHATAPCAVLAITDTGSGMDEATCERIFEPFFTTKEVGKGTGLGLAIVYGIVKQHGGTITVESEPGRGTTFRIFLPLHRGMQASANEDRDLALRPGTETVLLVEDNEDVRSLMRDMFTTAGYTIIEATNGADGLAQFNRMADGIQLVISDLVMPKMNGREMYEAIREVRPQLPVIFLSGYTDDIISRKGVLEEGYHFIAKPFLPGKMLELVRTVLSSQE